MNTNKNNKVRDLQFFLDRVGKRIYRDDDGCPCADCKRIVENGVRIMTKLHARYLFDVQLEYAIEGVFLNYRDNK